MKGWWKDAQLLHKGRQVVIMGYLARFSVPDLAYRDSPDRETLPRGWNAHKISHVLAGKNELLALAIADSKTGGHFDL